MNRSTKGAIAAAGGALLLLGGGGSLAFWTATGTVTGGALDTGSLALATPDCGSGWTLDAAGGGGTYVPGTTLLVPGDVITETCTAVLTATGAHMQGTIDATTPGITGAPANTFTLGVGNIIDTTTNTNLTNTGFTSTNNGDTLSIQVQVTFNDPGTADNSTQNLTALLSDVTITATQHHP
jgi:alternate signal-mediated exported protein